MYKARSSLPSNLLVPQHYLYRIDWTFAYVIYRNGIRNLLEKLHNEALETFQKCLSVFLEQTSPKCYEVVAVHFYIGYLYMKMTDQSMAKKHFLVGISLASSDHPIMQVASKISLNIEQKTLDFILVDLIMIDSKQFRVEEVPYLYEKVVLYYQQYPTQSPKVKHATICLHLASIYQKQKNADLSQKYLNDANAAMPQDIPAINENEKNDFMKLADALSDYASTSPDIDTAFPLLEKSLYIYEMLIPLTDPKIITIYNKLAAIYIVRANFPIAIMYLDKVIANPVNQEMYEKSKNKISSKV